MDAEMIARLQQNDPTLTSLRLATFFVNSLPQHQYALQSLLFLVTVLMVVPLLLLLVLGSCLSFDCCSLSYNQISDISALGAALATNTALTTLE